MKSACCFEDAHERCIVGGCECPCHKLGAYEDELQECFEKREEWQAVFEKSERDWVMRQTAMNRVSELSRRIAWLKAALA